MSMLQSKYVWLIFLIVLIIAFFFWQIMAYKAQEPAYSLLKKDGNIEIRKYPSLVIAEVHVNGERYTAINTGFRILADYIFGDNSDRQKIAMTAPVIQKNASASMGGWSVQFIMPAQFTLQTLPKPQNNQIHLVSLTAKKYVVIRFSGLNSDDNLQRHEKILREYMGNHGLKELSQPVYAFYNPPWILPFLRRNEILIEVN